MKHGKFVLIFVAGSGCSSRPARFPRSASDGAASGLAAFVPRHGGFPGRTSGGRRSGLRLVAHRRQLNREGHVHGLCGISPSFTAATPLRKAGSSREPVAGIRRPRETFVEASAVSPWRDGKRVRARPPSRQHVHREGTASDMTSRVFKQRLNAPQTRFCIATCRVCSAVETVH